ncbi:ABC transporter permease subunit [Ktedonobacter robiniae]|jgi:ABC-2 type transport system permease protein|uniref:ABC transporter n=1 Tax=Ktedonobacter robiniae TaxID=2778365 RepID=A0ABQ3UXG4_9CHLR|nr:ABC transporter permease subunit [Ktedonobacter robiniae]GHO57536.1 ABC transporter [Ktedonobacter robiniae]
MHKVLVILRKEFLEIVQQRILLFSILLPPLLFIVLPLFFLQLGGNGSRASSLHVPSLQGLTLHEYTQGLVGTEFSNIFILLSMLVPSTIAAYSIIGEKNSRTLEPLLATPVRRWQLLAGKMLAALLPAVLVTWVSGGLFIAELAILTDANVVSHVVTGGWLILFLASTPLLGLIAVAVMTAISSRVNDTRTAQQLSIWAVVPILGIILGELSGQFELTVLVAVITTVILIPLAILLTWGSAQLFQRETILTRWK